MEKIKNNWKKIVIIALVVLLIGTAVAIGILLYERELNSYRNEMIDELIEKQGTYDEKSIVLKNTSFGEAERLAKKLGAKLRITENGKFATLTLEDERSILDIFEDENNIRELKSLTPDYEARINSDTQDAEETEREPSAPFYQVNDALFSNQSYLNYMNLQGIWSKTKGKGMSIAVIDTGIDTDHPDLVGKISEYSYNATLDKIVKDWEGENGGYDWSLIEDQVGHGTQVAGVIGASMDTDGITGIAPEVEIVVIKAECNQNGTFVRTSDLVFGIYYAIECDVDVINMSFGTKMNYFGDATYLAYDSDIICVASAGNNGSSAENYPAADQYVIGVGALEADGWELAEYSNYGNNTDIVAPGTVYTTKMGGGYGTIEGTSFASPLVAGAISLYLSQNRYQTFDQVYELLSVSSMDLGDLGRDWYFGFGALDVSAFILEERGTITFEMLTDELDDIEATFIRNHTMQELPVPQRLYSLFDGWYYDDKCTEEYVYYEDVFTSDLTLYAKWINESDGIPYTYEILDDGTVEITSYTGHRRYISIPEKIEGRVVTSIGKGAFYQQGNIREINLPSQLKTIKSSAFEGCSSLLSIQIPDTVTSIGERAFYDCVRMSSIELSTSSQLTTVGQWAFASCGRIEAIDLPSTVESVDATAFLGNLMLTQINVMGGNESFVSKDGVLFNRYATELVAYPMGKSGDYIIPNSVLRINEYALAFSQLEFIDLANVVSIGSCAFKGSMIESLVIKDTVTSIGTGAFSICPALSEVYIGKGIKSIGSNVFSGCSYLRQITIPKNIESLGYGAFGRSGLTEISFESGSCLRIIGEEAFAGTNLISIELPSSVNLIERKAFYQCYSLNELIFDDASTLNSINDYAFSETGLKSVDFPLSLGYIGSFAFSKSALTGEAYIHQNIVRIGAGVFSYCDSLEAIKVAENNGVYCDIDGVLYTKDASQIYAYPSGNKSTSYKINELTSGIIPYSFAGAKNLFSVTIPSQLTVIGEFAFYDCGARAYNLNSVLEEISASAFARNENLQSITIPKSVKTISRGAFSYNTAMRSISFENDSSLVRIGNEAFYKSGITEVKIPAMVSTIGQGAFNGCTQLYRVTFEKNSKLNSISAYMFNGAVALKEIVFENGSQLKSLQAHAFDGMSGIEKIDLSNTEITNVDNFAFRFCESLSNLSLPSTVTYIGRYAFYGCSALNSMSLPSCLEYIGSYAFLGTDAMELYFMSETFPPYLQEEWDRGIKSYHLGVISVEERDGWKYAVLVDGGISIFSYTGQSKEIDMQALDLGGSIVSIGGHAFEFSNVENIKLPSTLTSIQAYAFANSKLKEITIPKGVTFIGQNAFLETPIRTLTLENESQLRVIEQYAFAYTRNLDSVSIPANVVTLGEGVFLNSGITSVTFDKDIEIEKIPPLAFAGTKIESLTLPNSVSLVDDNAFRETKELKSVDFGNNEYIQLMSNAFYLSGITELTIPSNVGYIGEFCFVGLTNLKEFKIDSDHPYYTVIDGLLYEKDERKLVCVPGGRHGAITLPKALEEIGFGAFEYSSLEKVEFHKDSNILTLGYRAFFGMENLKEITVPKTVVSIDYYAFAYCTSLERVFFEDGSRLNGIYEGAFCGDELLYDITLPDEVLEISDYVFYGCSAIKKLPISSNSKIKGIYSYAFAYTGLTELNLPATVFDVGEYAFKGTSIEKAYIPNDNYEVLVIGYGAFDSCNYLEEITVPFIGSSLYYPESTLFSYIFNIVPQSLRVVNLSETITLIPPSSFAGLSNIERINIPATVTTVSDKAFSLTSAKYELLSPVYVNTPNQDWVGTGISGNVVLTGKLKTAGFYGCTELTSLTLPEGVTAITSFEGCTSLESVNIPAGVTAIGNNVFRDCTSLKRLNAHSGITKIGERAFYRCTGLEEITGLSGLKEMGNDAFYGCTSLKSIDSLGSIATIPAYAFSHCTSLEKVPLPSTLTQIGSYAFMECYSLQEVEIPNGVSKIGTNAFVNCRGLRKIHIPGSVSVIDEYVFRGCQGLINVTVAEGVTGINRFAFYECYILREISLPSTLSSILGNAFALTDVDVIRNNSSLKLTIGVADYGEIAKKAHTIYDKNGNATHKDPSSPYTYYTTSDGFKFIVDNNEYRLTEYVGDLDTVTLPSSVNGKAYTLDGVLGVKNVIIPNSFTEINAKAFYQNTLIESVVIEEGITKIDNEAFYFCKSLKDITLPSTLKVIGDDVFRSCALTRLELDSVTSLGKNAFTSCDKLEFVRLGKIEAMNSTFYGCSSLKEITIPSTVTKIQGSAFTNCTSLESIIIPEGVTALGDFSGCTSLKAIKLPSTLRECGSFARCTSLVSITLPDGIQSVPNFTDCKSLRYVYLGKSARGISSSAFSGCDSLNEIEINAGNTSFSSSNGIIYSTLNNEKSVVFSTPALSGEITIDNGTTVINASAFENNKKITGVIIPSTVVEIGVSAFRGCTLLESVSFGGGAIKDRAFSDCTSLKNINLDGATQIGEYAFNNCDSLRTVKLGQSLTIIDDYAFNSSGIESINIPSSVTELNSGAFMFCEGLVEASLPDGLARIPYNCFAYCYNLRRVNIPSKTETISENAFTSCSNLARVEFPNGVTEIGSEAFYGTAITEITLPSSLTAIGSNAFNNCKGLYLVNNNSNISLTVGSTANGRVAEKAKAIKNKNGAYQYASGISDYSYIDTKDGIRFALSGSKYTLVGYIGDDTDSVIELPSTINNQAYELSALAGFVRVKLPNTITEIAPNAFQQNGSLKEIIIPSSVKKINYGAFTLCQRLEEVFICSGVEEIGGYAFKECRNLRKVTLENGVIALESECFANNPKLEEINIPSSVKTIGSYAFSDCTSLNKVTLGANIELIEHDVFRNTAFFDNKENWMGEALIVNDYLLAITDECEVYPYYDGLKCVSAISGARISQVVVFDENIKLSTSSSTDTLIFVNMPRTKVLHEFFGKNKQIPSTLKNIVILDAGVPMANPDFFEKATGLNIYLSKTEKDLRWDANYPGWSNGNQVYYEDEWVCAEFYNDDVIIKRSYLLNSQLIVRPYIYDTYDETTIYGLTGWDLDGDGIKDRIPVTSSTDIKAYAVFGEKERRYTVSFLDKNGDEVAIYTLPYGEKIQAPNAPQIKGYDFVLWDGYYEGITVNKDMTFTALMLHKGNGHEYTKGVYVEPSCIKGGGYLYTCAVCDEAYFNQTESEKGHMLTDTIVPPTCVAKGYTLYHCENCDAVNIQHSFVPKAEHSYGEWSIVNEASCTENGSKIRYCDDCRRGDVEIIRKNGHEYSIDIIEESSCIKTGIANYTCKTCNDVSQGELKLAAHSYELKECSYEFISDLVELMPNIFVGRSGDDAFFYECSHCKDISTQDAGSVQTNSAGIGACTHVAGNWQVVKYAQGTQNGIFGKYCVFCSILVEAKVYAPVQIIEKGADYIKYQVFQGYEYSIDGVNYLNDGIFSGLDSNKEYIIYVRDKETKEDLGPTLVATAKTYTYTFYDYNGNILKQEAVFEGEKIVVPSFTPSRDKDVQYTYTFSHYEGYTEGMVVTKDVSFTAVYNKVLNQYTYIFYDEDGTTELKKITADYGTAIIMPQTDPTKEGNGEASYTFSHYEGFTKGMLLTGDISFRAVFTQSKVKYTYSFIDIDGKVVQSGTLEYGSVVIAPSIPTNPQYPQGQYNGVWKGYYEGYILTGNVEFRLEYVDTSKKFSCAFTDWNGRILYSYIGTAGSLIVLPETEPSRNATLSHTYTFIGYEGYYEGMVLTESKVFVAMYEEKPIMYTYSFLDWDGSVISSGELMYGERIPKPNDPTRPNEGEILYTFIGYTGYFDNMIINSDVSFTAEYRATMGGLFEAYTNEAYGAPGQIVIIDLYAEQLSGRSGIIELFIDSEYASVVQIYLYAPNISTESRNDYVKIYLDDPLKQDTKIIGIALMIKENAPLGMLDVLTAGTNVSSDFKKIELCLLGDVDQNGVIDNADIDLLNRYALGEFELSEREQYFADVFKTDVYEPGSHINAKDVLRLRQLIKAQKTASDEPLNVQSSTFNGLAAYEEPMAETVNFIQKTDTCAAILPKSYREDRYFIIISRKGELIYA